MKKHEKMVREWEEFAVREASRLVVEEGAKSALTTVEAIKLGARIVSDRILNNLNGVLR